MNLPQTTFLDLIVELARLHHPSVERLADAATPIETAQLETWLGIALPREVHEVFSLHNGQADHFDVGAFFNQTFLSIAQILDELSIHDEIRRSGIVNDDPLEDARTSANFPATFHVPILSDGTGNFIGCDLCPSSQGQFGQVIVFGADVGVCVIYDSLSELWESLLKELHSGAWVIYYDDHNGIEQLRLTPESEKLRLFWI